MASSKEWELQVCAWLPASDAVQLHMRDWGMARRLCCGSATPSLRSAGSCCIKQRRAIAAHFSALGAAYAADS